jgi:hypothetical protein
VRLEWSVSGTPSAAGGELLDRSGRPMSIPVQFTERAGDPGPRTFVAELTLAPLAEGDYAIRVHAEWSGEQRDAVAAFRIVP